MESPVESQTVHSRPSSDGDPKSKEEQVAKEEVPAQPPASDFPDGGLRAWLVVLGGACGYFATFGFMNAWGVFQAYYTENTLSGTSPSTIAWIGSVQYCLIFLLGPISGRLFDMGHFKITMFIASCCLVAATFLVAECKEYWQLLLCQGFAIGLSSGMIFSPLLTVVAHWFKRKRGLALGFLSVGSSVGGTVIPIITRNLISAVGFQWTMRILGFIIFACLGVCNLTVFRRLPPKENLGSFVNLGAFREAPYTVYCIGTFIALLGLYTVLTYIDISAVFVGISSDFSFYLVAIANASSGFGRIAGGMLADKVGPLNIMVPTTLIAAALTYAWPFARSKAAFIIIAILYGAASGVYVTLLPAPIMAMGQLHDVGARIGMALVGLALGILAGPPIAGAINHATGNYEAAGYYAGSICVLAGIFLFATRQLLLGPRLWGKY